eukprot:scaffold611329_cov18-Prasinocladus_malaysianus.AAC.1
MQNAQRGNCYYACRFFTFFPLRLWRCNRASRKGPQAGAPSSRTPASKAGTRGGPTARGQLLPYVTALRTSRIWKKKRTSTRTQRYAHHAREEKTKKFDI